MNTQELYDLLPAVYRLRDAEKDEALKAYLSVFAWQIAVLKENIEQLYDDQFIETCAEWLVPYKGDLIGYEPLHNLPTDLLSQRAEVANTLAYRRRKGTASMLEQLARDVTGWPARVVEYFDLLATSQFMNHVRPHNQLTVDVRNRADLEHIDSAFDAFAHTPDVRHIDTDGGLYNIKNIGIHIWRIQSHSIKTQPAVVATDGPRPGLYRFSALNHDIALYNRPEREPAITHIATPNNVPMPISHHRLFTGLNELFGKKNLNIYVKAPTSSEFSSAMEQYAIRVCCLASSNGSWINLPESEPDKYIAIDPESGRLAVPPNVESENLEFKVSYHYGFSANLGGGEYDRDHLLPPLATTDQGIKDGGSIQNALDALAGKGKVEIQDSGIYSENLSIRVTAGQELTLRAGNKHRPVIQLNNELLITDDNSISDKATVVFNGLVMTGGQVLIPASVANIGTLIVRHCTLVPGLALNPAGEPVQPDAPSLVVACDDIEVIIEDSIVGGLRIHEGAEVRIKNSIIDATDKNRVAYAAIDNESAAAPLEIENSTIIGKVHTRIMHRASNCIFASELAAGDVWSSPVMAERKQQGCVRFSAVPLGARLPRRYRCQPELAIREATQNISNPVKKAELARQIESRLSVIFTDQRYGQPAYMQLHAVNAAEILSGADDESEMGVWHDLYQPQRIINLKIRLKEYLRFGLEAGIFYAS